MGECMYVVTPEPHSHNTEQPTEQQLIKAKEMHNVRFYRYLYMYMLYRADQLKSGIFHVKVPGLLVNHIGSLKSLTFLKPDFSGVGLVSQVVCEIPHRLHKPFMSSRSQWLPSNTIFCPR